MQHKCLNWKKAAAVLAALLMLATGACTDRAGSPVAKTDAPQFLPENIITAWTEAGGEVGWLRVRPNGFPEFVGEKEGKHGDLPAFCFDEWQEGRLATLPAPAMAFGLDLGDSEVTDAGLKELVGWRACKRWTLAARR